MTRVLAPGKVMLFGEYAVLEGAEALVVAIDRHVTCTAQANDCLRILGLGVNGYATPTEIKSPFLESVVSALGAVDAEFVVDSRDFHASFSEVSSQKLGLGSSAAVTVAFSLALARILDVKGLHTPQELYEFAQTVHHQTQGLGSGADIAAICFGGAIRYRWLSAAGNETPTSESASVMSTDFGVGVCERLPYPFKSVTMVWSGQSANTRQLVKSVQTARQKSPRTYSNLIAQIDAASQHGIQGWLASDRVSLCDSAQAGTQALIALGQFAKTKLVTERHLWLQSIASRYGAFVKPTGAGGGDLAWLVSQSPSDEVRVKEAFIHEGVPVLQFRINPMGASVRP